MSVTGPGDALQAEVQPSAIDHAEVNHLATWIFRDARSTPWAVARYWAWAALGITKLERFANGLNPNGDAEERS